MAIADTLKKIPTWGWLLVGGASLGVGYSLYRDKRNPDALEGSAGQTDLEAGLGSDDYYYAGSQPSPIGVVSPAAPYDNTGQVGAIGQTAFETLVEAVTGVVETVPALIEAGRGEPPVINVMPAAPSPAAAPEPPRQGPAPPQTSVNILGKHFAGAYRYQEIPTPRLKSRDFNVFWRKPHKDQRWRRNPDGKWTKIAEGNFGG